MLDLLFRATHARLNWIELAGGINYFFSITLSKSLIDSLIAFWEWEERFRGWKLCCTPWTRSTPTRRSSPTSPSVPSFLTRAGVNDDLIMTILFVPQSGALSRLYLWAFKSILWWSVAVCDIRGATAISDGLLGWWQWRPCWLLSHFLFSIFWDFHSYET